MIRQKEGSKDQKKIKHKGEQLSKEDIADRYQKEKEKIDRLLLDIDLFLVGCFVGQAKTSQEKVAATDQIDNFLKDLIQQGIFIRGEDNQCFG